MDPKRQAAIVAALVEGVGIRSTCRITGASKGAVTKLIADLRPVCAKYMDEAFHDLPCKTLELDEIWAFCYAKAKNVPEDKKGTFGYGDVWTFTAIDADTKLIPSFMVGSRDAGTAHEFCQDLASRLGACAPENFGRDLLPSASSRVGASKAGLGGYEPCFGRVRALLKDNGRYSGRAAHLLSPYFHSIRGFNCLRLRARHTNVHSPATFAKPLRLN
jgi:hypothetical protein